MTQQGFETDLPTLYHPYDLQHVHHPRLFSRADRGHRDDRYRALASRSIFTVAMTSWGARDLLQWLGASSPALAVVRPGASPSEFRPTGHTAPGRTLIYPARTWPHKNHEMLLRALARLDGDHADVTLVLTGSGTERGGLLYDVARSLGVEHRVTWLGYVSDERLAQLLVDAAALVFPSRFEGWGMPITEAMVLGTPVVCSDLPVLREVAGDAALYADPASVDGFVDAIRRVLSDRDLSVELVANGRARTEGLTWQEAASRLVALQLAVGGRTLDEEDRAAFERAVSEAAPLSS